MNLCASCREPIPPTSPSDDFCREQCQLTWYAGRADPARTGTAAGGPFPVRDRRPVAGSA